MPFKHNQVVWYLALFSGVGVLVLIIILYFVKVYMKRITDIKMLPGHIRGMVLKGIVKRIPDGDGFRFLHVPMFRSKNGKDRKKWLPIRIAGIDAPEMACFGNPGQLGANESKEFLKKLILGKLVTIKLLKTERYDRLLCRVYIRKRIRRYDVAAEMLKAGQACVYTGSDADYDGKLEKYKKLESKAKKLKLGMWKYKQPTPMEYKKNLRLKNSIK